VVDGIAGNCQVKEQQSPPSGLPEFARAYISEKVELRDGVGSIEALGQQADIKLQPAMASDLARVMNAEGENPYQQIVSIYWSISPTAIRGVLDQIRTALTQLVAELRANMPADGDLPSAETATSTTRFARGSTSTMTARASSRKRRWLHDYSPALRR
jgi:AbiTii